MISFLRITRLSVSERGKIGSKYFTRNGSLFRKKYISISNMMFRIINRDLSSIFFKKNQLSEYPLINKIGEGKFAVCYYSKTKENIPVVIKYRKQRWCFLSQCNAESEIKILSKINNPHIPKIIDIINEGKSRNIVLEYKPGITIRDMIFKQNKRFTLLETIDIFRQILDIIEYLHANSIVHHEIRPQNVLYDDGCVNLVDFGFANYYNGESHIYELDFVCLGELLLFLLYSNYKGVSNDSWLNELELNEAQKVFIKKMLMILQPHHHISEVCQDFKTCFDQRSKIWKPIKE